jgi:hypothetical protein
MISYRRSVVLVVAVALIAGGATAASAAWSKIGGGTGNAGTGVVQPVTLSAGTPGSSLYPGGSVGVTVTATNANIGAQKIGRIELDTSQGTGGFAVDGAHTSCVLTALSFATQTNGGAGWDLPARVGVTNGTLDITMANSLSMSTAAANACQGATFTVYVKASP